VSVARQPAPPSVQPAAADHPAPPAPGFGSALGLELVLALGLAAVAIAFALIVRQPSPLPEPFPSLGIPTQNQHAETLAFVLTFLVAVPVPLVVGPRLGRSIAAGAGPEAAGIVGAGLAVALAALPLVLRAVGAIGLPDGVRTLLVLGGLWWLLAGAVLIRATRPRPWPGLERLAGLRAPAWIAAGVLVAGDVLVVTRVHGLSAVGVVVGLVVAAAALLAARRRWPAPGRWGLVADGVILILVILAVPDLVIVRPEAIGGNFAEAFRIAILRFHQDFLLAPANQVLHGGAMLVDTASQYGVGSIYALAAWFKIAPIGYGTLGLLDGVLTALWFGAAYGVLRVARTSRTVAGGALALAVIALAFHQTYPIGSLPQDGPLRFGLPILVVLARVAGARRPGRPGAAGVVAGAVVGLSAIWSVEAFASVTVVYAAMVLLEAWLRPAGGRLRFVGGQAAIAAGWILVAQLALALTTLAALGRWPDWGVYLGYLHAFLIGNLGIFTYDVGHWSPGVAVGALYVASAAGVVELARRARASQEHPVILALGGMTVYGIVLFYYFVDRSEPHILVRVSLPALTVAALWLGLLVRQRAALPAAARWGGAVLAAVVAIVVLSAAWPSIGDRFPRTALARAFPGGAGLRASVQRLWHMPPLSSTAPEGAHLLAKDMPGETHSLVLTLPDLGTEILMRADRADRLRLGDPTEASYVPFHELPRLRGQLAGLRPGDRMLLDASARRAIAAVRAHPELDPLQSISGTQLIGLLATSDRLAPEQLGVLQVWILRWIVQHFGLRTVDRDTQGFSVVQLTPKP
jgi:hypothetical protein